MEPSNLADKVVVVPGGTGNVGEGNTRAFLRAGARVVVPGRSADRLNELERLVSETATGELITVEATYGTPAEADELFGDLLTRMGAIDHVVSSVGGWWAGPLLWQTTSDDWQRFFVDIATSHFAIARAALPRLAPGGSLTFITGVSADQPYPGAGIVSMQGAALLMMRSVLSAELNGQRRVNDLMLGPVVNRSRTHGDATWLSADDVGTAAVAAASNDALTDRHVVLNNQDELARFLSAA